MKSFNRLLGALPRAVLVLVLAIGLLQAVTSRTQAAGPPPIACCAPGYLPKDGYCQQDICPTFMEFLCLPSTILYGDGTVMQAICTDTRQSFCQINANILSRQARGWEYICSGTFRYEETPQGKVYEAVSNLDLSTAIKLPPAGVDACIFFMSNSFGLNITKDSACTDDQTCYNNACIEEQYILCDQVGPDYQDQCTSCLDKKGIWTAIGCVESSAQGIVAQIMTVGLGVAGGLALLMFLVAAFKLTTSQGEPKETAEAKEILQAAVIGLLFIIFSVTILQFIGVTILHIPGFGI